LRVRIHSLPEFPVVLSLKIRLSPGRFEPELRMFWTFSNDAVPAVNPLRTGKPSGKRCSPV
jgi:hypothetical protein